MEALYVRLSWKGERLGCITKQADLKVVQTRTSSENVDDEFVELCLACEPNVFRTVICRFGMGESGRGRAWMCVTYGVEHETAISVESDLPFVLMGFVLFLITFRVKVKVKVKEPRPKIKFKKKVGNDRLEKRVPNICACIAKTAWRKTL